MAMGKSELRALTLGRRRAMSDQERDNAAEALAAHLAALPVAAGAQRIACYVSMTYEPGTRPILAALLNRGISVIVPIALPSKQLDWVAFSADAELVQTTMGTHEPGGERLGPEAIAGVDLVVVPALAVDHRGYRLGRGAGYYDRALAQVTAPTAALLFNGEIIDEVPHEPHDVPVTMAITPSGVFRVPQEDTR